MRATFLKFVPKETWNEEYGVIHAIPSSSRDEPAKALVLFADLLRLNDLRALDLGCGNGRNAIYLAKRRCVVNATDFSEEALSATRRRACANGVQDRITLQQTDITRKLDFPSGYFDLILDSYTFCHILDDELSRTFWQDIEPLLNSDGHVLSISFSVEDMYYSQFLSGCGRVVTDPSNDVSKRLYDEAELKAFFTSLFVIKYFSRFEFIDVVHGKDYLRVVLIAVLQRR